MSANLLNSVTLRALGEQRANFVVDGQVYRFLPWRRQQQSVFKGGESYVCLLESEQGERFALKNFFALSAERMRRSVFLASMGLWDVLPAFHGAPRTAIKGEIPAPSGNGTLPVAGHLSSYVDGLDGSETLFSLDLPLASRVRLAKQLCCATLLLERSGLAHTDLKLQNIKIQGADGDDPMLQILDFDAFFHRDVPILPIDGGRTSGSEGYRHSMYANPGEGTVAQTDLVALAILIFELVVLRPGDEQMLKRETLFDQANLNERRPVAPKEITARWPDAWTLVHRAIEVEHPEEAPSLETWMHLLLAMSLNLQVRHLHRPDARYVWPIQTSSRTLGEIDARLGWLTYRQVEQGVISLSGTCIEPPLFYRRRGGLFRREAGAFLIRLEIGDLVRWGDFDIAVSTSPTWARGRSGQQDDRLGHHVLQTG